jgi:hypothetical protein
VTIENKQTRANQGNEQAEKCTDDVTNQPKEVPCKTLSRRSLQAVGTNHSTTAEFQMRQERIATFHKVRNMRVRTFT